MTGLFGCLGVNGIRNRSHASCLNPFGRTQFILCSWHKSLLHRGGRVARALPALNGSLRTIIGYGLNI